jgi:PAS domain-containing protein
MNVKTGNYALREQTTQQELQSFIETANAPVFDIDAEGRVNEWKNKAPSRSAP